MWGAPAAAPLSSFHDTSDLGPRRVFGHTLLRSAVIFTAVKLLGSRAAAHALAAPARSGAGAAGEGAAIRYPCTWSAPSSISRARVAVIAHINAFLWSSAMLYAR